MSSDYEFSDDDGDYYDDGDMMDTQEDEDDDEMMGSYDDFKITPKGKHKSYEVEYESLSQDAVEKLMSADVEHICGIFGVDRDAALLLLRSMSWNKERLIEKYMDNATSVLCAAGIQVPEPTPETSRAHSTTARRSTRSTSKFLGLGSTSKPKSPTSPVATSPKPFVCPICFDDSPDLTTRALVCEHQFCTGCWATYICSKIRDEGEHAIRCMAEGCHIIAPDTFVRTVLSSEDGDPEENALALSRFHELVVRHFVASNASLKYCPYPGCTNTVSCPSASSKSSLILMVPTVSCGARGIGGQSMSASQVLEKGGGLGIQAKEHKFCFGCPIDGDHRPLICTVARMWIKKCRDDSETANWIKSNTKECTNCLSTIEKNGGCNHMTCKKCKHEFCWVCMGPWSEHGTQWYSCNRYDEKAGIDARDAQSRSRASLERYLHYYNRWANHEQSAKLSIDLYAKTEKKMEDMQVTSALTWIEVQFMKKAVEEVDKCRMTLKWTYAMAYYLAKSNEKDLFEDNQRDLEKAVEDLSELLESPIEPENIPQLRQKVTDKTVYVQNRNEIVLEDTANGFLEGRWKWNAVVEGFDEPERLEY
ncbi:hypothetical protein BDN71DRAFT_1443979 [Pleurotus eryngii]|uniref:RBR-type E3 ubiquitin transferase n=1 Tax=Pleurotus eryngii TaxID=5323 RepID=A0A9P6DAW1_PLEER|nr:hypothetical protein BDN71DRAFT_1443979 [Pleurotus eryngii]